MADSTEMKVTDVPLASIVISELNTRKNLDSGTEDAGLDELARSIAQQGLISPPTLRRMHDGSLEVISGQRRILALRKLGRETVPAVVRQFEDSEAIALSLVENVQRADMHPLDKANALKALEQMHGSIGAVADRTGVGPRTVRRYLALLSLAPELQRQVQSGSGPAGVGFMSQLANTFSPDEQAEVFDKVKGFTGGLAEEIIRRSGGDAGHIDTLVDLAIQGQFDRFKCGTSLETCPHLPAKLRPVVRALLASEEQ